MSRPSGLILGSTFAVNNLPLISQLQTALCSGTISHQDPASTSRKVGLTQLPGISGLLHLIRRFDERLSAGYTTLPNNVRLNNSQPLSPTRHTSRRHSHRTLTRESSRLINISVFYNPREILIHYLGWRFFYNGPCNSMALQVNSKFSDNHLLLCLGTIPIHCHHKHLRYSKQEER